MIEHNSEGTAKVNNKHYNCLQEKLEKYSKPLIYAIYKNKERERAKKITSLLATS